MKDKISEILCNNLDYIYCHNCKYSSLDDYHRNECHRKYMNWVISKDFANKLAEQILQLIKEERENETV